MGEQSELKLKNLSKVSMCRVIFDSLLLRHGKEEASSHLLGATLSARWWSMWITSPGVFRRCANWI